MRKIKIEDVLDLTAYEKQRKDCRPKIMAIKDKRRIHVGPKATYLFENYDTMWYQVQEMARAERIVEEEGVQGESVSLSPIKSRSRNRPAFLLVAKSG